MATTSSKNDLILYFLTENGNTVKQTLKYPISDTNTIVTIATNLNSSLEGSLADMWYDDKYDEKIVKLAKIETYDQMTRVTPIFEV